MVDAYTELLGHFALTSIDAASAQITGYPGSIGRFSQRLRGAETTILRQALDSGNFLVVYAAARFVRSAIENEW